MNDYYNPDPKTERGHARLEFYNGQTKPAEEFGLHKRSRRLKRGAMVSKPDGTWPTK